MFFRCRDVARNVSTMVRQKQKNRTFAADSQKYAKIHC
jgi:hypothetical protein